VIDSDAASHTDDRRRDSRRDILFGIGAAVAAVLLVWLLYTIRDTLLLIYVSALLAMRISPLVGAIERQRLIPFGGRLPRWVAILIIYSATVGGVMVVGALVLPSLVAQAEALRRDLPDKLSEAQQVLLSAGVLRPITTLNEAVEQAPVSDGATALTTLWLTLRNIMGASSSSRSSSSRTRCSWRRSWDTRSAWEP
jgi:predicted PurR-regulated permease PerM